MLLGALSGCEGNTFSIDASCQKSRAVDAPY